VRTPKKKPAVTVSIEKAQCSVMSTTALPCPLCAQTVPPNTRHECTRDGGITTVRNVPWRPR